MESVMSVPRPARREVRGWAYCPICTHTVETEVIAAGKRVAVKPGQKCPRCSSSLEPATVVRYEAAA
jgi:uncharacterized protein (UPF0212 family)